MLSGSDWVDVQEAEVRHDTKIRFGEYETTPMDLVRDQDKTMVQARATPAAAEPPRPAPPKPAPPKPAPPAPPRAAAPAAPRPAPPSPPRPAAPRPAGAPGAGMDKKTMWILIGGGGGLLLLVLIAVVVVLVTGGDQQTTEVRPPARTETPAAPSTPTTPAPRTETPTPPAQPTQPPPRTETPPAQGGMQRMTQACRTRWQGSDAVCQCVMRAVQPVLQEGDYDDAIEVMTMVFTDKGDEARQKVQQMVAQGGQEKAQRIVSAVQAIGRDCKSVQ
jgi:hypothetical protein